MRLPLLFVLLVSCSCLDLALPPQPGVGPPGLVSGRLVWQRPGRLSLEPARGASVFILGTNLAAASNDDGRFLIDGLISGEGSLLIRFDGDGDGHPERQRALLLSELGAGRGRQLSLGDVTLGQSAAVSGRVLVGDSTDPSGHFGTPVFVPGFPLATLSQPDGTFFLEGLAEGSAQLGAVRNGYQAWLSGPLVLRGGEELSLARVSLLREVQPVSGVLRGRVVGADGVALGGVTVTTGGGRSATTDGLGTWRLSGLTVDRYDVTFAAAGRLPAALYNVLVAGPDEVATPDVVLAQGQSPAATPSLVNDVAMERDAGDAGGFDAGGRDAGFDAGLDGGFDAGSVDAGYTVSIGGLPPTISLGMGNVSLAALVSPPPGAATYSWVASPPGIVMIGSPTSQNTGLAPQAPGSFRLDVSVTFGGQTYMAFATSAVVGAGPLSLGITDAGVTPLAIWLDCEGPFAPAALMGQVVNGSTQVPAVLSYNGVNGRLVAAFDEPQPDASITLSLPMLTLLDGGLRAPVSVTRTTSALAFGPAVVAVDGGLVDFNAGATYRPTGFVAVGRHFDNGTCVNGCMHIHENGQGLDLTLGATGAPVPWRRANAAGFSIQAWLSTMQGFQATGFGNTWGPGVLPPGPVFSDGPNLRAVSQQGTTLELSTWTGSAWMPVTDIIGSFGMGVSQRRSSVVSLGGSLVALVIDDSGQVEVHKKPFGTGTWINLSASLPALPTILSGRIAATNAGYVMFLNHASGSLLFTFSFGNGTWVQRTFTGKPLDVVGRGSRAYLASANGTTEVLEVWLVDPVSGSLTPVGVPVSGPVRSAELAVADFGELGVAWSIQGAAFDLLLAELK